MGEEAKYVGFDIETAAIVPEGESIRDHRPLGVTCAGFDTADADHGLPTTIGAAGARMTPAEIRKVVETLEAYVEAGYTIATWNGLAFDFDVLAEEAEPDVAQRIAELATGDSHVDVMFHFLCTKGFRCGLAKALEGMGLEGKTEGVSGALAPQLWADGERSTVLEYVHQDARIQRLLTEKVDAEGRLYWITGKGKRSHAVLGVPRSPKRALLIPEPDVGWMDNPPKREWSYWWAEKLGIEMAPKESKPF